MEEINMDEFDFLCELRHAGTHKFLPSLRMLQKAAESMLLFFYKDYWLPKFEKL